MGQATVSLALDLVDREHLLRERRDLLSHPGPQDREGCDDGEEPRQVRQRGILDLRRGLDGRDEQPDDGRDAEHRQRNREHQEECLLCVVYESGGRHGGYSAGASVVDASLAEPSEASLAGPVSASASTTASDGASSGEDSDPASTGGVGLAASVVVLERTHSGAVAV